MVKIDTREINEKSLSYGTFLGGGAQNDVYRTSGNGVAVDDEQIAYVIGNTHSPDIFLVNNGIKSASIAKSNAFLVKIDTKLPGAPSQVYGTYVGGDNGEDFGTSVALDKNGLVYVTGDTTSSVGVPITPITALYSTKQGFNCSYLIKINTNLPGSSGLIYGTYVGGNSNTLGRGVAVDKNGIAYITGNTDSTVFLFKDGFEKDYQGGIRDSYLVGLNTNLPGFSGLIYGTYIGGNQFDHGTSIAVDQRLNVYIVGYTSSHNFPVKNAYQDEMKDETDNIQDGFLVKIGPKPNLNIDLKLEKSTCKCKTCVGEKVPYTIKLRNNGQETVYDIIVTDIIYSGVYVTSMNASLGSLNQNNDKVIWSIPQLDPGDTAVAMIVEIATSKVCFSTNRNIINECEVSEIDGIAVKNVSDTVIIPIDCSCNCKKLSNNDM